MTDIEINSVALVKRPYITSLPYKEGPIFRAHCKQLSTLDIHVLLEHKRLSLLTIDCPHNNNSSLGDAAVDELSQDVLFSEKFSGFLPVYNSFALALLSRIRF